MECQVNVAQDGGERVDGDYKGRRWSGWTDGLTTWKPFRIPHKANSDPEYVDSEINFDLAAHAEGIGMTGWDWVNRVSKWVAFDFDAIVGHSDKHSKKLTPDELDSVIKAVHDIEWVTVRYSTSGKGLHLYVFLNDVPTKNHTEHAALARSILGKLSALTGFDFQSKVDACGGNMWVWHRKMKDTCGLQLIKRGGILYDIPLNWQDHLKVVTGHRRKTEPSVIEKLDLFEQLSSQRPRVPLDSTHKKLIEFLKTSGAMWWWDQDHHMLIAHTYDLKEAHAALQARGLFDTIATGSEHGTDINCFCFPMRDGAWSVRRYTPGVQEHESWDQDSAGWTRTYFNKAPDLRTAARVFGGLEDTNGGFVFQEAEMAAKAAASLGAEIQLAPSLLARPATLKEHKDGRLIVELTYNQYDRPSDMTGWLQKGNKWLRIFNANLITNSETEIGNYDDLIRHLVTASEEDYGWVIKSDGVWRTEPKHHIKDALAALGYNAKEIAHILGGSIMKCWRLVNKPFQPEYPGDREWNRNAAQFRFVPSQNTDSLQYPTWLKILNHCGRGLDDTIKEDRWCQANGIISGADYLKCWIASVFKEPLEPLPYLFFYGGQNSGKSIFHEALSLLLTKGYMRADLALVSSSGFNAELEGAIICVIEETDLRRDKQAYNRIKDWVTSKDLVIHRKGETPYHIPNSTHFIQCSNEITACPVFPGDTRITMLFVDAIEEIIPKKVILPLLEKEAPDFLAEILNLELPTSGDRLNIPALQTDDKLFASKMNQSDLERFIDDNYIHVPGAWIKFSEFVDAFWAYIGRGEIANWSKIRIGREIPPPFIKGRNRQDGHFYIGNIWPRKDEKPLTSGKYIFVDGFLDLVPA